MICPLFPRSSTVLLQLFQLVTLDLPFGCDDFQIFSEFLQLFVDLLQVPRNQHGSDTTTGGISNQSQNEERITEPYARPA